VCAALATLGLTLPAAATVVPPTPEQIIMMNKREGLENRARTAFGDIGLIEKLRDWRKSWGFILVGEEGSTRAPRLLIKDEYGWYEMRAGETRRLSVALGLELNRLLHRTELWAEDAYNFHSKCEGTPWLFVIMHAGQDKFGRLGCGPQGLAAQVAHTAERFEPSPGKLRPPLRRDRSLRIRLGRLLSISRRRTKCLGSCSRWSRHGSARPLLDSSNPMLRTSF
jgi:hypothetical protein